jgi:hypothetical protein
VIVIERSWPMGDMPDRIFFMARVDGGSAEMHWASRDTRFGRMLEKIESVPVES